MPKTKVKSDQNFKLFLNTRRHLLLAIVMIWATVALIFFAIKPQLSPILKLRSNLETERKQYLELTKKIQDLNNIKVSDQFLKKDKVDEVLPSHKPISELLFNLYQTMNSSNTNITALSINPGEIASESANVLIESSAQASQNPTKKNNKKYGILAMDLTVIGSEPEVDQFLDLVERISPLTSIVELSIKLKTNRDDTKVTEAQLLLNTYYYTQVITTRVEEELPSIGEAELKVFDTVQKFTPSEFKKPDTLEGANIEDLFGIKGFEF